MTCPLPMDENVVQYQLSELMRKIEQDIYTKAKKRKREPWEDLPEYILNFQLCYPEKKKGKKK